MDDKTSDEDVRHLALKILGVFCFPLAISAIMAVMLGIEEEAAASLVMTTFGCTLAACYILHYMCKGK